MSFYLSLLGALVVIIAIGWRRTGREEEIFPAHSNEPTGKASETPAEFHIENLNAADEEIPRGFDDNEVKPTREL